MFIFYYNLLLYGSGNLALLAVMQKVAFISSMLLLIGLEHFGRAHDFKVPEA